MAVYFNTTQNAIPLHADGYSPNTRPNNNQVILTSKLANNAVLQLANGVSVYPGFFLSKASCGSNDVTMVLPSTASAAAKNLWIFTEGLIPDTFGIDTVQGNVNGQPQAFTNGQSINVVPMPSRGTVIQTYVNFAANATPTVNAPLYLSSNGYLTAASTDSTIVDPNFVVGYIYAMNIPTIANAGQYQVYVMISPGYIES